LYPKIGAMMKWFWAPRTKENGTEYSEDDILENSSIYIHKGWSYCGVYFLIDCYEVVYVGQSVDVKSRLQQHSDSGNKGMAYEKNFNRFFFIQCEKEELKKLEAYYILKFRPKYNISIPKVQNEI
jgi:predicted GIY-YIG superfamily endonuclease